MNKDEKLLEKVYDGDMTILSAMEQQAVAFAEWLHNNEWVWLPNKQRYCNINKPLVYFTPQEVYNEFNQQN